ncbi:MAG: SDR family NAD(P)-dependent oxidoreductase [Dehalococcoidia bacterium]
MLKRLSLEGRSAIVTGGGTGLGLAMARALARAGADVAIGARRPGPIEEAAQEVRSLGRRALAIPTDVSDSAQVERLVQQTLAEFDRVDVLINNARLIQAVVRSPIWEITDEAWQQALDVNLSGAFYCARAVSRHMVEQGRGKIINVASGFGLRGGRDMYTYCCTKGGLIQLTRTLAISLGRYGVTSNTIVPGFIPTRSAMAAEGTARREEFVPIGRFGRPEDVGQAVVFLASDASDYMNGELLVLDGGSLAGGFAPTGYALEGSYNAP